MSTSIIIAAIDLEGTARRLERELADLTVEIFITVYGLDWQQAHDRALKMLADLMAFADAYDEYVEEASNEQQ